MPLTPPVEREALHTRRVECHGYRRHDGLWDIEGHLVDTKTYPFPNRWRGDVVAGEPVHEMWLRVTIDDEMLIHDAQASTEFSPFEMCADITPAYQQLIGVRIGPGWTRIIKEKLGGIKGCTHLGELLRPIATAAYQTLAARKRYMTEAQRQAWEDPERRPMVLKTCHAYAEDSAVVKTFYPLFYKPPA
ncbi:MAG: DUF2889 domain-containing protein [Gammaproteobacteria bacterium]|nr:DUF2889 domain-containing protein [Gammaproteobacteria bacterium]